jgi:hypothetical protein
VGTDHCGVPGCDWRPDTNAKYNSHSNTDSDRYTRTNTKAHSNTEASSNTKAPPNSAAETLIRYGSSRAGRDEGFLRSINIFGHQPMREKIPEYVLLTIKASAAATTITGVINS